ncbi:MAG TPA: hypothetical protein ENF42_01900 [Candidatus Bathyarchaeota archaeon]|nr:hypothetical protein [Candidatus Bathyarchaeota archaeon]
MKTQTIVVIAVVVILVIVGGYYTYVQMAKPPTPTGEVVLKVRGMIEKKNAGDENHFDLQMLEKLIDTEFDWECPWFGMYHWEGVSLLTLLEEVGASSDATYIEFVASDGVTARYPIEMLKNHPKIMLALKMNGSYIPEEMVGPLRVVIPYNIYPDLEEDYPAFPYTVGWIIEANVGKD